MLPKLAKLILLGDLGGIDSSSTTSRTSGPLS